MPVPPRRDVRAWRELKERLRERDREGARTDWVLKTRSRHQVEREISELRRQPQTRERDNRLAYLYHKLEEL
jgi:hypothetical protein